MGAPNNDVSTCILRQAPANDALAFWTRNAAVQLVNEWMDFDPVMDELADMKFYYKSKPEIINACHGYAMEVAMTVQTKETICDHLKLQASSCEMEMEDVAIHAILRRLSESAQQHHTILCVNNLYDWCSVLEEVAGIQNLKALIMRTKYNHCLPLNILLQLRDSTILSIKDFLIINVDNKTVLTEFICALSTILNRSLITNGRSFNSSPVAAGILSDLIQFAYDDANLLQRTVKRMCGYIFTDVVSRHLQHLISLHPVTSVSQVDSPILCLIHENLISKLDVMQKGFIRVMMSWFVDSPIVKDFDAISLQHLWICSKQNEALVAFYKKMITYNRPKSILFALGNILETRELNWKNILTFISTWVVTVSESVKIVKEFIADKLDIAIKSSSRELLIMSLLFARQLSLETSDTCLSYTSWFQQYFGKQSSLTSSNRAFTFLVNCLIDVAPYEPLRYLKVHIVKPPYIPASCSDKFKLYVMKARARIADGSGNCDPQKVVQKFGFPRVQSNVTYVKSGICQSDDLELPKGKKTVIGDGPSIAGDLNVQVKLQSLLRLTEIQLCHTGTNGGVKTLLDELIANFKRLLCSMDDTSSYACNDISELAMDLSCNKNDNGNGFYSEMAKEFLAWLSEIREAFLNSCIDGNLLRHLISGILHECRLFGTELCKEVWKSLTAGGQVCKMSDGKMQGISMFLSLVQQTIHVRVPTPGHYQRRVLKSRCFVKTVKNWEAFVSSDFTSAVEYNLQFYEDKKSFLSLLKFVCYTIQNSACFITDVEVNLLNIFKHLSMRITYSGIDDEGPLPKRIKLARTEEERCLKLYREIFSNFQPSVLEMSRAEFLALEMFLNVDNDILNCEKRQIMYAKVFFGSLCSPTEFVDLLEILLNELSCNQNLNAIPNQEVLAFVWNSIPLIYTNCTECNCIAKVLCKLMKKRALAWHSSGLFGDMYQNHEEKALVALLLKLNPAFPFVHGPVMSRCSENSEDSNASKMKMVAMLITNFLLPAARSPSCYFALHHTVLSHLVLGILEQRISCEEFLYFAIVMCPCVFSSLLIIWNSSPFFSFIMKNKNPEMHSFVDSIWIGFSSKNFLEIYRNLTWKLSCILTKGDLDIGSSINFCIACVFLDRIYSDMKDPRSLKPFLSNVTKDLLSYIAICVIEKFSGNCLQPTSAEVQSLLPCCLSLMRPRDVCEKVLMGHIMSEVSGLSNHHRRDRFQSGTLRILASTNIPQAVLCSRHFLPVLLELKQSSLCSANMQYNDEFSASEVDRLNSVESHAIRNSSCELLVECFQRFHTEELGHEIARRNLTAA